MLGLEIKRSQQGQIQAAIVERVLIHRERHRGGAALSETMRLFRRKTCEKALKFVELYEAKEHFERCAQGLLGTDCAVIGECHCRGDLPAQVKLCEQVGAFLSPEAAKEAGCTCRGLGATEQCDEAGIEKGELREAAKLICYHAGF